MKMKQDLKDYAENGLEFLVRSHLEGWHSRYIGQSISEAVSDFKLNFDWRGELENIKYEMGRELSEREEAYIFKKYLTFFRKNFKESIQEGYRIAIGFYLK